MAAQTSVARDTLGRAENLLEAVNGAAATVRGLYITFLLLGTYLGVTFASTTHEQLVLGSDVRLPLLNTALPIDRFYIFAPWLFLLIHFNMLLQLAMLARKVHRFDKCIVAFSEENTLLIERLPVFPFIHMLLSGPRDRLLQSVQAIMTWITIVALPLWLLVWAQITFLPYHNSYITWGQRAAVMADVAMLWFFWPRIMGERRILGRWVGWILAWLRGRIPEPTSAYAERMASGGSAAVLLLTSLIALIVSWLVAFVPDEKWEKCLLYKASDLLIHEYPSLGEPKTTEPENARRAFKPTHFLFEESKLFWRNLDLDEDTQLTAAPLSPKLIDQLTEGKLEMLKKAFSEIEGANLRERDLKYAKLSWSFLPRADLQDAKLHRAELEGVRLQKAKLQGAFLPNAILNKAQLQWADLSRAFLNGVFLREARLENAVLEEIDLQGADLTDAKLQKVNLYTANLKTAILDTAKLQGANLRRTFLEEASLIDADLQCADLREAFLKETDLRNSDLHGAFLKGADLYGAILEGADLRGAILRDANLQGANLKEAQLMGADMRGASIDGAQLDGAVLDLADLRDINGDKLPLNKSDSAADCLTGTPKALPECITDEDKYWTALMEYLTTLAYNTLTDFDLDLTQSMLRRADGYERQAELEARLKAKLSKKDLQEQPKAPQQQRCEFGPPQTSLTGTPA